MPLLPLVSDMVAALELLYELSSGNDDIAIIVILEELRDLADIRAAGVASAVI